MDSRSGAVPSREGVPLFTDLHLARALVEALCSRRAMPFGVRSWNEYLS